MKLTQRQSLIASLLIKQNGYKTVKHYAKQLNISERTIHLDLKVVEKYLLQEGYELEKKPGVGIGVIKTSKDQSIKKFIDESNIYSTSGRRKKIIELMLFENRTVTFDFLSELFLISKTSINNDLKFIRKMLISGNDLKMISDSYGTRLLGTERDIQKAHLEFNRFVLEEDHILLDSDDDKRMEILSDFYGKDIVSVCARVLYSYVKNDINAIAEYYVFNILNMMSILVYRILKGYHIDELSVPIEERSDIFFEKSAKEMLTKISLRLNFTFTPNDVEYLSTYLISNRFEPLPAEQRYHEVVTNVILKVSESLKIDFTKDNKLREQLMLHIPPMIYRLQEGIQTNNPFIFQIKKEFSLVYNLIWIVMSEYEDELNVIFNEDEIGFLTIHFQSAIEKAKFGKKILIVCPTGIATSELLLNRIINILPSLTTVEVASIKELSERNLDDLDLIISTVKLNHPDKKVVVVSPLLSHQDMKNISDMYNERFVLSEENENIQSNFVNLNKYLFDDYIFINEDFQTKDILLKGVGNSMVKDKIVDSKSIDSMITRENLGGTDLPTGAAIPHCNLKYVNRTTIVLITNKKPIKWNENFVRFVVMVCISEKDKKEIKGILSDIYTIVQNKEMINKLLEVSDKQELRKLLGCNVV